MEIVSLKRNERGLKKKDLNSVEFQWYWEKIKVSNGQGITEKEIIREVIIAKEIIIFLPVEHFVSYFVTIRAC